MTIVTILSLLVMLIVLCFGLVWALQERIAFQPPSGASSATSVSAELVNYLAEDGQPLLAYVVGKPDTARGLLLCFHGNADLAINGIIWAERVLSLTGFAVLLTEYRGYMGLGGRPSYRSSQLDSEAAYEYALHTWPARRLHFAFYGHSLGTAIATELASRHLPLVLILEAPFTSARDMARRIINLSVQLVWETIGRFHFETAEYVASLDAPVWVAHGGRDRVVPVDMGKQVFAAAKRQGKLLLVPDASHSDMAVVGDEAYWRWLEAALQSQP